MGSGNRRPRWETWGLLGAAALFASGLLSAGSDPVRASTAAVELSGDGADAQAVKAVCTRCHGAALFQSRPRTWAQWTGVFQRMTKRGANPTEEQVDHIVRYFLANLTIVNVNTSPADELGPALAVSDGVANAIVARRQREKFRNLADLARITGVNAAVLKQRQARILF